MRRKKVCHEETEQDHLVKGPGQAGEPDHAVGMRHRNSRRGVKAVARGTTEGEQAYEAEVGDSDIGFTQPVSRVGCA